MQRAQLFTGWEEAGALARPRDLARLWIPGLLVVLVAAAAAVILAHPKLPVWDQARLLESRFEAPYHPALPYGFTSQLLVIALKALLPVGVALHEALRVVAMAFWAGAATWLATVLLERRALVAVFLLLLFTSQYPFLWLSTELVAGGFLCLAVAARVRGAAPWVVGPLLALLGLCKMEMLLVSVVLLAFWVRDDASRRERALLAGGFAATVALLMLPGLLLVGADDWIRMGDDGQGRGIATFRQHFAALVAPFQIGPAPNPWLDSEPYFERAFPGADSMLGVLTAPGLPYLDFLALSLARGARKVGWVFQWGWIAVPILAWAWRRGGLQARPAERALLLSFVGCVPFVLFSYPHIRYFARYYPVFWLLLFVAVERLERLPRNRERATCLGATAMLVLLALAWNTRRAAVGLASAPHVQLYWFSD
jgi:hypothetical protein